MRTASKRRTSPGGWVDPKALPQGPEGRALCRRCGVEVPKGRKTFCSKECVHQWKLKTDVSYLRDVVFDRDKGVCGECGVDVFAGARWGNGSTRTRLARGSGDLWQADHIVPVVEGGGECDLTNLRTLCTECHRRETAALRERLAASRRSLRVSLVIKSLVLVLLSTALQGATINLLIPAFSGCADQFRCQYSGYSGSFATQPGAEINVDIGAMVFSYTPTPAPDQHDWYNFPYSVNGTPATGSLYYFAQVGGNAFFDFVFFAVPAGDPHLRFSTVLAVGPVDGHTRTPVVLEISDGNEPQGTVSAAIHAPEPGTWILAIATLIAMQIARSLLGGARATIAVGTANRRMNGNR